MTSTPSITSNDHNRLYRFFGHQRFVQSLIDNTINSIHLLKEQEHMKHKEQSIEFAKQKLRVYLLFLKRDKRQVRIAIKEFKELASKILTGVNECKYGKIGIVHGNGFYSPEKTNQDEQSRQAAISFRNSVDVMDFLYSKI